MGVTKYAYQNLGYQIAPELAGRDHERSHQTAIVGAGPCGLALAIDLALRGISSVVLDDNDVVSVGSRAICWAKRSLEIFDRLGIGDRTLERGVTWKVGRLFHGQDAIYSFDLLPENGHRMPAFVNLQQYYVEQFLVERARQFPKLIDLRFKNRVKAVDPLQNEVRLTVETPDGDYQVSAEYVVACDGSRSTVRNALELDFDGVPFEERFLIADVELQADFPPERWFWFDPPFHSGQSALLHKQPDGIYRIDLQLGWDADPDWEKRPENVIPRIEKMIGHRDFKLDWVSVYSFQCRRMASFVHGRVLFAGDAAHVVSPFGARGGNGGIQDIDNLGWKLAAVLNDQAGPELLRSYDEERIRAADENIGHSARATNFMTPKSAAERMLRDEVLALAKDHEFARRLINSGRLSTPCSLDGLSLQSPSSIGGLAPGRACVDAPLLLDGNPQWLLGLLGRDFTLLSFGPPPNLGLPNISEHTISRKGMGRLEDADGYAFERYGEGLCYLIRPDQHISAVFQSPRVDEVLRAVNRAFGRG